MCSFALQDGNQMLGDDDQAASSSREESNTEEKVCKI